MKFKVNFILVLFIAGLCACSPQFHLREGHRLYQMNNFEKALVQYAKVDSNLTATRMIAKCRFMTKDYVGCYESYSNIPQEQLDFEDWKFYANALIQTNQNERAVTLLENGPDGLDSILASAKLARVELPYTKITPTQWNTSGSSFSPFVVCNKVFYIGNKRNSTYKNDKLSNSHGDNLKIMSSDEDYSTSCGFPFNLMNSSLDEGPVTLGANRNIIVFTRNAPMNDRMGAGRPQLYEMHKKGLKWTFPTRISFCNEDAAFMHPTMLPDGNRMVFASNRCGSKGFDLYESYFDGKAWSFPVLLGDSINSDGDDVFPYLDGDNLYFSSNGRVGYGGLDLYVFQKETKVVKHLNAPFSSVSDDFGITRKDLGYNNWLISSNRQDESHVDHIFEVAMPKGKLTLVKFFSDKGIVLANGDIEIKVSKQQSSASTKGLIYKTNKDGEALVYLPKDYEIWMNGSMKLSGHHDQLGAPMVSSRMEIILK
jgi:hypothetical protein